MTTYFISRHPGAQDWARQNGHNTKMVTHFDPQSVQPGDTVLGTLPVHLAAEVCERGGRYFHLTLNIPAEMRGKELTADDMSQLGACLQEFEVKNV